jgi:UDPglucose 6-dehydrogenase
MNGKVPALANERLRASRQQAPHLAGRDDRALPTIGVMGAGWVGLVTAAGFAELGHEVVVRDVVPERIERLRQGVTPIHEPGLDERLARNRRRISFTVEARDVFERASIVFVCVGTPPSSSGDADLTAVHGVVDDVLATRDPLVLVMKSTVPVGTGDRVVARLAEHGADHVAYVSNPEFLAEGTAVHDFLRPQRVVIGSSVPDAADRVARLYEPLAAPVVRCDVASAEMIKYASNAFLATKISFINEIANVCEQMGADVEVVAEGMGLDDRIGPRFLRAGVGYGGSCFPKDVTALKQLAGNSGYHFQLLTAVIEVNELQKRRILTKLKRHLSPLTGKTVALLGLAFKPDTSDVRESPSLVLAARLLAEGAEVRAWDPAAVEEARALLPDVELSSDLDATLRGADAAIIVTDWDEVRRLELGWARKLMRRPLIVDGRNVLDPEAARAAGFVYECVGRPSPHVHDAAWAEQLLRAAAAFAAVRA